MKLLLLLAFLFLNITAASSQSSGKPQAKQDTNYIDILASKWSIRIHGISKYDQFAFSGQGFTATYKPDVKVAIGIGASYKNLAMDLGLNLFSSDPSHKSRNLALLSSLYSGPNLLEITAQLYDHYSTVIDKPGGEDGYSEFRTDIHTLNLGLGYNYSFNHRRLSLDAASIGTQIQKRSAGTPLAGAFLSYFHLNADSGIISSAYGNPDALISEADLITGGISAGYAHTIVLPAHFYIMLSITPKLALNSGRIQTDIDHTVPLNVTPGFLTRNAIGYAGKKYYGFLSVLADYNTINTGSGNFISYDPVKVKLLVGYRFE